MRSANQKLNIYVVPASSSDGTEGWTTSPWNPSGKFHHNGSTYGNPLHVMVSQATYTAWGNATRSSRGRDQGKTIVHEVGHFLGLEHFTGSDGRFNCDDADGIADTNTQIKNVNETGTFEEAVDSPQTDFIKVLNSEGRLIRIYDKTCKTDINIWNHMQYSPDNYKVSFTPGQINAMGVKYPRIPKKISEIIVF